jgi:hypothetical protein
MLTFPALSSEAESQELLTLEKSISLGLSRSDTMAMIEGRSDVVLAGQWPNPVGKLHHHTESILRFLTR